MKYFLQNHGRQMVKMLVRHGANLEYVDHALRNALYWSVYNCCGEITTFLLDCGAKVKPWSWIADEALPASFTEDSQIFSRITKARQEPHSLLIQTRYSAFLKCQKFSFRKFGPKLPKILFVLKRVDFLLKTA